MALITILPPAFYSPAWHRPSPLTSCVYGFVCLVGFFFLRSSLTLLPRLSAVMLSQLTATFVSQVQEILLPQPPEQLGLQARATVPGHH